MDKKKKIAIIAVAAMLVIGIAAAVYVALSKNDNGYVDVPLTEIVTDENGEAVTDAEGQPVTETVTNAEGKPQTTKKAQQNSSSAPVADNDSNNNQGTEQNKKPDGDKKPAQDDKPEDKKPKNRKIEITAILPQGFSYEDIMEIRINGELDSEIAIKDADVENSTLIISTAESYKDDAEVEISLRSYKTTVKGTVLNNHESIKLYFPLNHVENITGEDD